MENRQPTPKFPKGGIVHDYDKGKGGIVYGKSYYADKTAEYVMSHHELLLNERQQRKLFESMKLPNYRTLGGHPFQRAPIGRTFKSYMWHVYKPVVYFVVVCLIILTLIIIF